MGGSSVCIPGIAEVQGSHTITLVVLARLFSNSTPASLQRAITAYHKLDPVKFKKQRPVRILPRRALRLNSVQVIRLAELYNAGANLRQLASELDIDRRTVSAHLRQFGVEMRHASHPIATVDEMAREYRSGRSLAAVGEKFGYDGETVRQALSGAGVAIRPRRGWNYD